MRFWCPSVAVTTALMASSAAAQTPLAVTSAESPAPVPPPMPAPTSTPTRSLTVTGYVEAFYSFNFNLPNNNLTAFRDFDSQSNSFSISNAVLDLSWLVGPVSGRIAAQIGTTGPSEYANEPGRPSGWGVGGVGSDLWRYLQQANVGWRAPIGRDGLLLEAGLFLSPIGMEGIAVKDQWNWSRSNLFAGLPYYHSGARATTALSAHWTATLMLCNGWNGITDNNDEKSVSLQALYTLPDRWTVSLLYFGGVERPPGAPEGRAFRNLFDAYVIWNATSALSFGINTDGGFEPNNLGTSWWTAGAVYARLRAASWLYLAARGDFFYESEPQGASPIFWLLNGNNQGWVSSGTFTLDTRPHDNVSIRLEYRHDQSAVPMYFSQTPQTDGAGMPLPTVAHQDTVTAGMVTWF